MILGPLPTRIRPRAVTAERIERIREVLDRRQPDLTVLMEKVHKPRNFSAILRTCDAVGILEAHAVPSEDGLSLHESVARGAARWVRVRRHEAVEEAAAHLRERGSRIVAAHPSNESVDFRSLDYTGPTAFLVGTELHGLTDRAVELADHRVEIPQNGMVRSLNVSVAVAVLLYEAERQRREAGLYAERRLEEDRYRRLLFEWAHPRVAEQCRKTGRPYPALGEEGEVLGREGT